MAMLNNQRVYLAQIPFLPRRSRDSTRCQNVEAAVCEMPQQWGATKAQQHTLRWDVAGEGCRPEAGFSPIPTYVCLAG